MPVFEIVKTIGRFAQAVPSAPFFSEEAQAWDYASKYMKANPDQFKVGLEGISIRRVVKTE